MAASAHAAPDRRSVRRARIATFAVSIAAAVTGFLLFLQFGLADGLDTVDVLRSGLILMSTFWLAWGAARRGLTRQPSGAMARRDADGKSNRNAEP
jgi:membrane glycosyltransferase